MTSWRRFITRQLLRVKYDPTHQPYAIGVDIGSGLAEFDSNKKGKRYENSNSKSKAERH